jgi:hypothetical protein
MFAPARQLDPLRLVHGMRNRYDCPDLAALDGHLDGLRHRIAAVGGWSADVTCHRADIDRLLDRRAWLTLPVVVNEPLPT